VWPHPALSRSQRMYMKGVLNSHRRKAAPADRQAGRQCSGGHRAQPYSWRKHWGSLLQQLLRRRWQQQSDHPACHTQHMAPPSLCSTCAPSIQQPAPTIVRHDSLLPAATGYIRSTQLNYHRARTHQPSTHPGPTHPAPPLVRHDALAGGHTEDGAADDGVQQELGAIVCGEGWAGPWADLA
jgi:hypothetical protein